MLTCPRSSLSFHSNAHHHGSLPQQLGMVWDLLLKADPEGPSPILSRSFTTQISHSHCHASTCVSATHFGEKIPHHHRKFHSQALRPLGDERLYQALIAIPEHAGHPVRDNRRREGCAEGCGWRRGLK